jgi:hypothetical protein
MIKEEFHLLKSISIAILKIARSRYAGLNCCNYIKPICTELEKAYRNYNIASGKLFELTQEKKIIFLLFIADDLSSTEKLFHDCSAFLTLDIAISATNHLWLHNLFKEFILMKRQKEEILMKNVFLSIFSKKLNSKYFCSDYFNLFNFFLMILKESNTDVKYEVIKRIHIFILNICKDSICSDKIKNLCLDYKKKFKLVV